MNNEKVIEANLVKYCVEIPFTELPNWIDSVKVTVHAVENFFGVPAHLLQTEPEADEPLIVERAP